MDTAGAVHPSAALCASPGSILLAPAQAILLRRSPRLFAQYPHVRLCAAPDRSRPRANLVGGDCGGDCGDRNGYLSASGNEALLPAELALDEFEVYVGWLPLWVVHPAECARIHHRLQPSQSVTGPANGRTI